MNKSAYLSITEPRIFRIRSVVLSTVLTNEGLRTNIDQEDVLVIRLLGLPNRFERNLREVDNLSTRDKWPVTNVLFVWRFTVQHFLALFCDCKYKI